MIERIFHQKNFLSSSFHQLFQNCFKIFFNIVSKFTQLKRKSFLIKNYLIWTLARTNLKLFKMQPGWRTEYRSRPKLQHCAVSSITTENSPSESKFFFSKRRDLILETMQSIIRIQVILSLKDMLEFFSTQFLRGSYCWSTVDFSSFMWILDKKCFIIFYWIDL